MEKLSFRGYHESPTICSTMHSILDTVRFIGLKSLFRQAKLSANTLMVLSRGEDHTRRSQRDWSEFQINQINKTNASISRQSDSIHWTTTLPPPIKKSFTSRKASASQIRISYKWLPKINKTRERETIEISIKIRTAHSGPNRVAPLIGSFIGQCPQCGLHTQELRFRVKVL